ncbi:MAG: hypothetical protein ACRC2M_21175, partial [Planktothrix sp.]
MKQKNKFVLCLPVKENPQTINRMFENLHPLLSAVAIYDTGSPPETIKAINNCMIKYNLPGEVIVRPWVEHFGFSRTEALRHAENVVFRIEKGLLGVAGKELKPDPTHPKHHIKTVLRQDIPNRPLTHDEYTYYTPDQINEKYNFLRTALELHNDWVLNGNWYYLITDADNSIIPGV